MQAQTGLEGGNGKALDRVGVHENIVSGPAGGQAIATECSALRPAASRISASSAPLDAPV